MSKNWIALAITALLCLTGLQFAGKLPMGDYTFAVCFCVLVGASAIACAIASDNARKCRGDDE
jgi:hypothetical protein